VTSPTYATTSPGATYVTRAPSSTIPISTVDEVLIEFRLEFGFFEDIKEPTMMDYDKLTMYIKRFTDDLFEEIFRDISETIFVSSTPTVETYVYDPTNIYMVQADVTLVIAFDGSSTEVPTDANLIKPISESEYLVNFITTYLWQDVGGIWYEVKTIVASSTESLTPLPLDPVLTLTPTLTPARTIDNDLLPARDYAVIVKTSLHVGISSDPLIEPTRDEYRSLALHTIEFFDKVFSEVFDDNPEIGYVSVTPFISANSFSPEEEEPVVVDIIFEVAFFTEKENLPAEDKLYGIMVDGIQQLQFLTKTLQVGIWAEVDSVRLDHDTGLNSPTQAPTIGFNTPNTNKPAAMPHKVMLAVEISYFFFAGFVASPNDADYEQLLIKTKSFFDSYMTNTYEDIIESNFLYVDCGIRDNGNVDSLGYVLVIFDCDTFFDKESSVLPTSDSVYDVLQDAPLSDYLMIYLWENSDITGDKDIWYDIQTTELTN